MTPKSLLSLVLLAGMCAGSAFAMDPITIADQGSFMAGGRTVTAEGAYDGSNPASFAGQTLHGAATPLNLS